MKEKQQAVIYSRVSGDIDNLEVIGGLLHQEEMSLQYAVQNNLDVKNQFRFFGSTIDPIHQMRLLNVLDYMDAYGIHVLICHDACRLFRNFLHQRIIKEWLDSDKNNELHFAGDIVPKVRKC